MQTELMRVQLLDWLYDFQLEHPGTFARIVDFLPVEDRADEHLHAVWRGLVGDLAADGLVMDASGGGFDGLAAAITASGRQDVEARRVRRNDRATRNVQIRDAVIAWLYANAPARDLAPMRESHRYEGERLTERELDAALQYLLDKGLVTGHDAAGGLINIELTDRGIDCAEHSGGSVHAYLRQQDSGNTTVNFHAPVTGSTVAWANRDVTQTAHATTGVAGDELATLVSAIKQALPVLGLDDIETARLQSQLDVIEGELDGPDPDPGVVTSVMRRVVGKIGEVATSSLGLLLTAYTKVLMQKAGVPLD